MKLKRTHKIRLGLMIILSLVLLVLTVFYLGKERFLFREVISVKTVFKDIKGLKVGNNVRYLGMEAGTVAKIQIINDTSVLVTMSLDKDYTRFIKKDAKAQIESEGVMGSRVITIIPGTSNFPAIQENDQLVSVTVKSVEDFVNEASTLLNNGKKLANEFVDIAGKVNRGKGDISLLLNEDRVTSQINQLSSELHSLASELNSIMDKVNKGEGDLARLLNDDNLTNQVDGILTELDTVTKITNKIAANLLQTTQSINSGDGTINKLLYDSTFASSFDSTLIKVNSGLDEISQTAEAIEKSWIINLFSKKKKRDANKKQINTTSLEADN